MQLLPIKKIVANPNNPRIIKDDKFKKLVQSIKDFPKMLELRPIVIDENNVVLGGNMRLRALQELGIKEVPVLYANDLTEEQKKEFIIKDNVGFGEWDWDVLANEWNEEELTEWGLDVPIDKMIDKLEDGEEILLEQAIQLKPKREYVVIMCDEENSEWDELKQVLQLPMVKRGACKTTSPFEKHTSTQRVIHAKQIINALRSTK